MKASEIKTKFNSIVSGHNFASGKSKEVELKDKFKNGIYKELQKLEKKNDIDFQIEVYVNDSMLVTVDFLFSVKGQDENGSRKVASSTSLYISSRATTRINGRVYVRSDRGFVFYALRK